MPIKRFLLGLSSELTISGLKKLCRAISNKSILMTGFSQLSNVNMVTRSASERVQVKYCCKLDPGFYIHADTPMHTHTYILHSESFATVKLSRPSNIREVFSLNRVINLSQCTTLKGKSLRAMGAKRTKFTNIIKD